MGLKSTGVKIYMDIKVLLLPLNQQPDEVIITFDDDIIYPVDAIKRLMDKHIQYPDCIVCERAQAIDYEKDGTLKNPGRWKTISKIGCKQPSYSLNPSPGGGCLIPYNGFYKDAKMQRKLESWRIKMMICGICLWPLKIGPRQ